MVHEWIIHEYMAHKIKSKTLSPDSGQTACVWSGAYYRPTIQNRNSHSLWSPAICWPRYLNKLPPLPASDCSSPRSVLFLSSSAFLPLLFWSDACSKSLSLLRLLMISWFPSHRFFLRPNFPVVCFYLSFSWCAPPFITPGKRRWLCNVFVEKSRKKFSCKC